MSFRQHLYLIATIMVIHPIFTIIWQGAVGSIPILEILTFSVGVFLFTRVSGVENGRSTDITAVKLVLFVLTGVLVIMVPVAVLFGSMAGHFGSVLINLVLGGLGITLLISALIHLPAKQGSSD